MEKVIVVDYAGRRHPDDRRPRCLVARLGPNAEPVAPSSTGSEDPVMIAYTSGTTGRPKGAVHVQAGLTVKLAAEGAFHAEIGREDVVWATDMGWIMGPWMVLAGLANGAALATYDGAPDHPGPDRLWAVAANLGVTFLGSHPLSSAPSSPTAPSTPAT